MKRAKGNETPLKEQGQERVLGRTAGVQRAAGPLRQVQSGERMVSVQRWTLGSPPKPSAAVSVGRGGAAE